MASRSPAELVLPSLQGVRILVVGDLMLDRYWRGDARRVSQEAPVPVVNVTRESGRPGGAANTALNIASLGAACVLVGAVGDDEAARELESRLSAAGVVCDFVSVADWPTTVKLRIVSQNQQLLRADFEQPLPVAAAAAVLERARGHLQDCAGLVLQDYDKGALATPEPFIDAARSAGVPVVVDPKHKPLERYRGASLIKPNLAEFQAAVLRRDPDADLSSDRALVSAGLDLAAALNLEALVITRGGAGMTVTTGAGAHHHVPARPVDVFDVTGAGDTAAATLAITRALGWPAADSAVVANTAAGLVVAKSGTAAVTGPELAAALRGQGGSARGVLNQAQLQDLAAAARAAGERLVFTNGCFDILHAGHVTYLEEARQLGDRLIVAVNDDASVRRLKGPGRPVNALERRLRVLSGLASVDWVVGFTEDTPEALLNRLQPDVLVKGGDYGPDQVVGADIVRGYGGDVRVLSLVDDCSTSAIVDRITRQDR